MKSGFSRCRDRRGLYLTDFNILGGKRREVSEQGDAQSGSFIGPVYRDDEILSFMQRQGAVYHKLADGAEGAKQIASILAQEKIVGMFSGHSMFSGHMEFGPRSLLARARFSAIRVRPIRNRA